MERSGVGRVLLGLLVGALAAQPPGHATPLENTHVGGLNRGSVVEPHPASMARNPATIGLLKGTHVFLDGTVRLETGRIRRTPIRSSTGVPGSGADLSFERERFAHFTPDLYLGATSDLGTDRVVLGLAIFTPFGELQRFADPVSEAPPGGDATLRYHRIRSEWFHLYVLPTVAVRLHDRLRIGLGFGYVRSMLRMSFGRDCAIRSCRGGVAEAPPFEDPRWTEKVTVDGGENSFMFNLGLLIRLPAGFDVGLAYRSKVVGVNQNHIDTEGSAVVRLYDPDATVPGWQTVRGRAQVTYELPDSLAVGLKWQRNKWDAMAGFEWVRWGVHENLKFTLSGNDLREVDMSNFDLNFVRHRGFRDVFRVRALAGRRFGTVHLSWGALFESSAVPRRWVSAAAVDAHKLDLLVAVTWRPHKRVGLYLGYSVTLAPEVEVTDSGFDPRHATGCIDDQVDILWSDRCQRVAEGKGIPTAAGSYWQMVHRLGVGVSFDYE